MNNGGATRSGRACVVVIAFACEPGAGSEEGVGWSWTAAASLVADVLLITTAHCGPATRAAALERGLAVEVVEVDLPRWASPLFPSKLIFVRYVVWQVLAARAVRRAERERDVAATHHLTWGSDSLPSALLASRAPVRIWGPVGGSTKTARGLYRYLSPRGRLDQAFRDGANGLLRRVFGDRVARHATLVAALNQDVADRFASAGTPVAVEPHVALDPPDEAIPAPLRVAFGTPEWAGPTAVFVGRLIPWKGLLLSVQTLLYAPTWRLLVVGEGPEQSRAELLAARIGVTDRVEFVGRVPRVDVLDAFRVVDALLLPSFHDSAPWSVGEASAAGCPVVCLAGAGGTSLVAGPNAHATPIGDGRDLPERLASCLNGLDGRGRSDSRYLTSRLPTLLHDWYELDPDVGTPVAGHDRPVTVPTPAARSGSPRVGRPMNGSGAGRTDSHAMGLGEAKE